jgi:hypothetical protein
MPGSPVFSHRNSMFTQPTNQNRQTIINVQQTMSSPMANRNGVNVRKSSDYS